MCFAVVAIVLKGQGGMYDCKREAQARGSNRKAVEESFREIASISSMRFRDSRDHILIAFWSNHVTYPHLTCKSDYARIRSIVIFGAEAMVRF